MVISKQPKQWQVTMRWLGFFLIFLSLFSLAHADQVQVNISESAVVTQLTSGNYSILAYGNLTLYNPSVSDTVYQYSLPLDLDPFVSIGKSSNTLNASSFEVTSTRVKGYLLEPNAQITMPYIIYGVTGYNVLSNISNTSLFEYYTDSLDYEFVPKPLISLSKVERENESQFTSPRFVIAEILNPSAFDYTLRNMSIYKTNASDPSFTNGSIIDGRENISIPSNSHVEFDLYDEVSYNSSVYWLSADLVIDYNLSSTFSSSLVQEQGSTSSGSSSGGGDRSSGLTFFVDPLPQEYSLSVKKGANTTLVGDGEYVEITLSVTNNLDEEVSGALFTDSFRTDLYNLVDSDVEAGINGTLNFDLGTLEPYESKEFSYVIVNRRNINGSVTLPRARVVVDESTFLSNEVTLVHDLLADKRVFIEKEVLPYDDRFSQVRITIRNLGDFTVEDLLVADNIDNESVVRQLSQVFHEGNRGIWSIPELEPGEEWIITYLVEKDAVDLNTLPNIFGVDKQDVFGILIAPKEVVLQFSEDSTLRIERIGLGLAVGLVLFYLFF